MAASGNYLVLGRSWGAIMSKSALIEGSMNVQLTGLGKNTDWRYIYIFFLCDI
jgi:hypothetical protein